MACVYKHIREDKNEPFYIGISNKNFPGINLYANKTNHRACSLHRAKNPIHKRIVNNTNVIVEILHNNIPLEEAKNLEIFYIKKYGRIDIKTGTLANLTSGGDGLHNLSPNSRKKIGDAHRGKKITKHVKEKLRQANLGKKVSIETRKKISLANIGKVKPAFSNEHLKNLSLSHQGYVTPNDTKIKLSIAAKNYIKNNPNVKKRMSVVGKKNASKNFTIKVMCIHCNKVGNKGIMTRWHFDNCKLKK